MQTPEPCFIELLLYGKQTITCHTAILTCNFMETHSISHCNDLLNQNHIVNNNALQILIL